MAEELLVTLNRSDSSSFGFSLLGTAGPPHVIYDIVENSPAAESGKLFFTVKDTYVCTHVASFMRKGYFDRLGGIGTPTAAFLFVRLFCPLYGTFDASHTWGTSLYRNILLYHSFIQTYTSQFLTSLGSSASSP